MRKMAILLAAGIALLAGCSPSPKPPTGRWIGNYESNNLAYIEFYEEDFPWRYTPVNPDDNTTDTARRLRPWLTLVVLTDQEYVLNQKDEGRLTILHRKICLT